MWQTRWVEREGCHAMQLVLEGDLGDAGPDLLKFWCPTVLAAIGAAEQTSIAEFSKLALQRTDD